MGRIGTHRVDNIYVGRKNKELGAPGYLILHVCLYGAEDVRQAGHLIELEKKGVSLKSHAIDISHQAVASYWSVRSAGWQVLNMANYIYIKPIDFPCACHGEIDQS